MDVNKDANGSRRLDSFSLLLGLCSLCAMIAGVIPSISFSYYDEAVGYYDLIQFLPESGAVMAVVVMSCVIVTVVFAYLSVIPRIVCVVTSSAAAGIATVSVVTLDIGIVYSKRGITSALYGEAVGGSGLNYGVEYNFVIAVFVVLLFASLALSCAAFAAERSRYDDTPNTRRRAELRKVPSDAPSDTPAESEKSAGAFKKPDEL